MMLTNFSLDLSQPPAYTAKLQIVNQIACLFAPSFHLYSLHCASTHKTMLSSHEILQQTTRNFS